MPFRCLYRWYCATTGWMSFTYLTCRASTGKESVQMQHYSKHDGMHRKHDMEPNPHAAAHGHFHREGAYLSSLRLFEIPLELSQELLQPLLFLTQGGKRGLAACTG